MLSSLNYSDMNELKSVRVSDYILISILKNGVKAYNVTVLIKGKIFTLNTFYTEEAARLFANVIYKGFKSINNED